MLGQSATPIKTRHDARAVGRKRISPISTGLCLLSIQSVPSSLLPHMQISDDRVVTFSPRDHYGYAPRDRMRWDVEKARR